MTSGRATESGLPLLAVVFSPRSRPWREIVDAGGETCRFLWVLDTGVEGVDTTAKVLRRFGRVVDVAGRSPEEIVQLVSNERPDGITSFFDLDLHRHAWLAAALGLPGPSVRAVARLTDKVLQRQAFETAGIPSPRFCTVHEPLEADEIDRLCNKLRFPVVVKPRNGTASRDVTLAADRVELTRLLGTASHPSQLIVEERMEDLPPGSSPYADRVSVDSLVNRGVVSHVGISGLFPMVPPFRSSGGFFPAEVPADQVPELFDLATAALHSLGADFGCYRTEIKLTPQGRGIIEVNGRPSGITPVNVALASGLPLLQLCMRLALGEHVVVEGPIRCDRVAYRYYCEPPLSAQRFLGANGLDELGRLPGVVQIDVHKSAGDPVDWRNGSLDKIFQVTGVVGNHEELVRHYRACTEDVVVTYEHRS